MPHAAAVAASVAVMVATVRAFAVEGGSVDRTTTHAVAIATGGPGAPRVRCSGTLVSPSVVLTVRHCIAGTSDEAARCEGTFPETPGAPTDFWVTAAPTAQPSDGWKNVRAWVTPQPNRPCGADLALLVLDGSFRAEEATPAAIVTTEAAFEGAVLARITGVAGFGASSPDGGGEGTRRSRFDLPIRCVPGMTGFDCNADLDRLDASEISTGGGPCTGDSGAGAMVAGDRGAIFGVLSRGAAGCGAAIFERTDRWRWLIARTVLEASSTEAPPPAWATSVFPAQPGLGDACRDDAECGPAASCVSFDGARSFGCAARCGEGCAADAHCSGGVCAPGAPAHDGDDAGCAVSGHERGATPASFVLLAMAFLLATRIRGAHARRSGIGAVERSGLVTVRGSGRRRGR